MTTKSINLTDQLYEYLLSISLRETSVMKQLREETAKLSNSVKQISPEQGQFMAFLIILTKAKKAIELGTYTGYSALVVASALEEGGQLITCDLDPTVTQIAQDYWKKAGVADKIELRLGPALETLDQLIANNESNSFDFCFIDADKTNYIHYYEKSLQLLRPGGLMAIDNVFWDGRVSDPSANDESTQTIRSLNQLVHTDQRVEMCVLPISDGLTLVKKR